MCCVLPVYVASGGTFIASPLKRKTEEEKETFLFPQHENKYSMPYVLMVPNGILMKRIKMSEGGGWKM